MIVLHSADWHLNDKQLPEISRCIDHMLSQAREIKPDLVCISGDVINSRMLRLDTESTRALLRCVSAFMDIAPVAIVIGTSSHDGRAALALRDCKGRFPILVSDMPEQFIFHKDGVFDRVGPDTTPSSGDAFIISQIPQPTKKFMVENDYIDHGLSIEESDRLIGLTMTNILGMMGESAERFDCPHIANGHFQVGGAFISDTQQMIGRDIEISTGQLDMLNADVVCLGHIHKAQALGHNAFYAGSPARMNFGELEDKGFYVHTLIQDEDMGGGFVRNLFVKNPAIYMHSAKLDMTSGKNDLPIDMIVEYMSEGISEDHPRWMAKIEVKVWQDEADSIRRDDLSGVMENRGAESSEVSIIRVPRETVRSARVIETDSLRDKLTAMGELRGESVPDSILEKADALESGDITA